MRLSPLSTRCTRRVGQPDVRPHRHDRRSRAARSGRVHDPAAFPGRRRGIRARHPAAGPVQRIVAETSDLDCATIVQRDLDDRRSQGHRSPNLDGKNPQTLRHARNSSNSLAQDNLQLNRTCPLCPISTLLTSDLDRCRFSFLISPWAPSSCGPAGFSSISPLDFLTDVSFSSAACCRAGAWSCPAACSRAPSSGWARR